MKAFILTLSIVGLVSAAKAQQITDKLLPSPKVPAWQQSFDKQLSVGDFKTPQLAVKSRSVASSRQLIAYEAIDNMPVVKLANTDKAMPIVQTDRTAYNMPIAGLRPANNQTANNSTQP